MKTSIYLLIIASIISFSAFSIENIETDEGQLFLASCQALTTPMQVNDKDRTNPGITLSCSVKS
ncbi:MAG: hypothetical protein IMF15_01600 [Proteobacteria bacterium]|nr:hypothetical protein [Pseudomonadota bacterium]